MTDVELAKKNGDELLKAKISIDQKFLCLR